MDLEYLAKCRAIFAESRAALEESAVKINELIEGVDTRIAMVSHEFRGAARSTHCEGCGGETGEWGKDCPGVAPPSEERG